MRQNICGSDGKQYDGIHSHDQKYGFQKISDDRAKCYSLLLSAKITDLPDHGYDCKGKCEYDTYYGDTGIDPPDTFMVKEYIDQCGFLCVVGYLSFSREDHHHVFNQRNKTKNQGLQQIKQPIDQILEKRLKPSFN